MGLERMFIWVFFEYLKAFSSAMFFEVLVVIVVVIVLGDYVLRQRMERKLRNVPIISKIPVIGSLLALYSFEPKNLHLKFGEYVARFGQTFYARVLGVTVVVTTNARYVDTLLASPVHIDKHIVYNMLRMWLGDGLLLSTGRKWLMMRKIITPTFHFQIMEEFVRIFDLHSTILVAKLSAFSDGLTTFNMYHFMGLLTLDVIAETAMGVKLNAQQHSDSEFVTAVNEVTKILATRFIRPILSYPRLFRFLAPKVFQRQNKGIDTMHAFTVKIIKKRRKLLKAAKREQSDSDDDGVKRKKAFLDVLLQASVNGVPLTNEEIRDEVNTFMFEGHDTTTSAISFCLYLLSRHSECQQRLFNEIRAHFGDDLDRPMTFKDLLQLDYLNCVVKESLRLYPPIPAIGRYLKEDLKFDDTTFPAGTNVIILLWQILRDSGVYDEPDHFRPDRHFENNPRATSFSYIPFSAGPRNCIGQRFALFEMKAVIIKLLRNYELLPYGPDVQPSIRIVLASSTGVYMSIRPREYN